MDVAGIVPVLRASHPAKDFVGDDLGETQDRVQRRAQFVAHIGQEIGLGGVGSFRLEALAQRLVAGLFQLARQILHLETQARVFLHPHHQGTSPPPQVKREERSGKGDGVIQRQGTGGKSQRRHD